MTKTIYNPTTNPIPNGLRPSDDDLNFRLPDGPMILCFDRGMVVDPARFDMHSLMVESVDEDGDYLCVIVQQPRNVTARSAISDSVRFEYSGKYAGMPESRLYLEAMRLAAEGIFVNPE